MRTYPVELIWPLVTVLYRNRAGRRLLGGLALLVVAVALLVIATGSAPPSVRATMAPTPVLSGIERGGQVSLARDCGYSAPLPGASRRSLWLFCDTPVYVEKPAAGGARTWTLQRFITGSTAAEGMAVAGPAPADRVPGPLTEVRTPRLQISFASGGVPASGVANAKGAPAEFLGSPGGLVTSLGLPCAYGGGYAASWASGVARVPSTPYLLITFTNYCVLGGSGGYLPEGFGLAEYDPATGILSHEVTVFSGLDLSFAPSAKLLGSPVFSGRYLYLFGPTCTALSFGKCATGTLFEARVPANPAAWGDPLSYQWWTGGSFGPWTSNAAAATSIIAGARPSAVSVGDFSAVGHHFVLVEQTDINGAFTVYQSPGPAGAWRKVRSGRVACRGGPGFANFCRAIIGHPELSTPEQLVLSYFDPAAGARGHVMVAGYRW